ncbi:MAG: glycosyltransferase family 4 protein, partial [Phycisphaerales bacterium]|nr:glycosyltransferase family 4 protein [Phycisphaerales bacterium]
MMLQPDVTESSLTIPPPTQDAMETVFARTTEPGTASSVLDSLAEQATAPLSIMQGYIGVFIVAFVVALLSTPIVRKLAVKNGIVDHPSEARKVHKMPIAYLGGIAVFAGIIAGIIYSYLASELPWLIDFHPTEHLEDGVFRPMVPPWIALGMTSIVLVGLIDDIGGIAPRIKLGGQLVAAAALAVGDVGTNVAQGLLRPTLGRLLDNPDLIYHIPLGFDLPMGIGSSIPIEITYWVGTAIIAIFVLGACNASNLIDGLDGL